jgi:hypothetical protein
MGAKIMSNIVSTIVCDCGTASPNKKPETKNRNDLFAIHASSSPW